MARGILVSLGRGGGQNGLNNFSDTHTMPELDAQIGMNYVYELSQGLINVNVGWLWAQYFNAIGVASHITSNVGFQGVYFGLKWGGNLA